MTNVPIRGIVLVDIDNTCFDATWREPMLENKEDKERWDRFHGECGKDPPQQDVLDLLKALYKSGYTLIALTGRTEKFRMATERKFMDHGVIIHDLLMRPDDNYQKSPDMKRGLVLDYFGTDEALLKREVAFIIDDRDDNLVPFRAMGITTLQITGRKS